MYRPIRLEKHLQCEKSLGLAGGTTKNRGNKEIRREHNSNPLQRHSHALVVFHVFLANPRNFTGGVYDDRSLYIYTSILECAGIIIIMMICDELMFLIHAVLSTGTHSPS